ncbi:MAG: hypothetical protein KIT22_18620, partial [Verrucomicrobiae bacterium]|nr:hypothetical protein [Verrucomicrobiae bacterium]
DVTNASLADAIPRNTCSPADVLTCTVTPSDGIANANPFTVSTEVRFTLDQWAQIQGAPNANVDDDSDRDGIPLLVEHALHTSPTQRSTLPSPVRLADGQIQWTLDVNPLADPRLDFTVETSTNLSDWTPATPNANKTVWTAGSAADTRRFARINATLR